VRFSFFLVCVIGAVGVRVKFKESEESEGSGVEDYDDAVMENETVLDDEIVNDDDDGDDDDDDGEKWGSEKDEKGDSADAKDVECKNKDCVWSFSDGCKPQHKKSNIKCTYRYKFGDMRPSSSCRCAGTGILTAKYGSIEEAFEALSGQAPAIDENAFLDLMAKYNVPPYTASWQFRKADKDESGSIDKDEFIASVGELMAATVGGDKALGSSKSRCCCSIKGEQPLPQDICVDLKNTLVYSLSGSNTFGGSVVEDSRTSLPVHAEGRKCVSTEIPHSIDILLHLQRPEGQTTQHAQRGNTEACRPYTISTFMSNLSHFGTPSQFVQSKQSASLGEKEVVVTLGDGLYKRGGQTHTQCVHQPYSHRRHRQVYRLLDESSSYRNVCRSSTTCKKNVTVNYCGHTNDPRGLVRYTKVGTVGRCVAEDDLKSKWFTEHKVCPEGMYHRHEGKASGLQVCDCRDQCP